MTTLREAATMALKDLLIIWNDSRPSVSALRAALAEQPAAPVVLTGEDLRNIARSLPPADCDRLTAEWRSVSMFARAAIAAAIPPGYCVVKDEPVAWYADVGRIEFSRIQRVGWTPLYAARPGEKK